MFANNSIKNVKIKIRKRYPDILFLDSIITFFASTILILNSVFSDFYNYSDESCNDIHMIFDNIKNSSYKIMNIAKSQTGQNMLNVL